MIKDCFTDKTLVLEIESDGLLEFNKANDEEYKLMAQRISKETGVSSDLIYNGEYRFKVYNWHKVDGEWYFYKSPGEHSFYCELLGEVISEYFGLDTVHYKIAKLVVDGQEDLYGVVSKNFYDKNFDYTDLNMKKCDISCFNQDLQVLEKIRTLCNSDEEFRLLQNDFKKMIIRDFYASESDRRIGNFMLCLTPNGIRLAPLFDYGYSYIDYSSVHRIMNDYAEFNVCNNTIQEILRSDDEFQQLLHLLMDADICSFVEEVEDRHKIIVPTAQVEHCKKYEKRIKEVVVENKLIV